MSQKIVVSLELLARSVDIADLPGIGFEGKSDLYKEMKALAA